MTSRLAALLVATLGKMTARHDSRGATVRVVVNGSLHRLTVPADMPASGLVVLLTGHWRNGKGPPEPYALFTKGGTEIDAATPAGELPELDEMTLRPRVVH